MSEAKLEEGDELLDRYRIERSLGEGTFAQVYLATHLALRSRYALKVLRSGTDAGSTVFADYVKRFRLEAQLGARIEHPNIVPVHDFEEKDDLLILRMDYAPGGSLAQRLEDMRKDEGVPLAVSDAVRIAVRWR